MKAKRTGGSHNNMEDSTRRIKDLIMCPHCCSDLKWLEDRLECPECNGRFPIRDGAINFVDYSSEKTWDSEFQAEQMFSKTLTSKLYNAGKRLVNSEYKPRDHIRQFISGVRQDSIVVELGSGNRRLRSDIINVDIFPFPNVDLVADIEKTPFKDNTVEFAILDTVLEHVPEPHKVIEELHRILRPGGRVVCITPFVFPYHGYPKHYFNFSKDGLEFLFRDFSECKVEMNLGPTSALTNLFSEYFALALSSENKLAYTFCKGALLLPVFFFKYLDRFWGFSGRATRIASHLCTLARK